MNSGNMFLPVKSDILFRLFFADERNQEFLISFLKSVLRLPNDEYSAIEIVDPHLLRECEDDKLAIIDVKLTTRTKKVIHIEIQLKVTPELKSRIVLYDAKLIAEQIGSGQGYDIINQVVSILITDEKLIKESPKYHHRFILYDKDADVEFSDLIEIHSLELGKLPESPDGTELYDWAGFIAAESDAEMDRVADRNPEVREAVVKYRELTADERVRDRYERAEKARRDQAMFLRYEIKQQKLETARNAISMNMNTETIIRLTGLAHDEIEHLRN